MFVYFSRTLIRPPTKKFADPFARRWQKPIVERRHTHLFLNRKGVRLYNAMNFIYFFVDFVWFVFCGFFGISIEMTEARARTKIREKKNNNSEADISITFMLSRERFATVNLGHDSPQMVRVCASGYLHPDHRAIEINQKNAPELACNWINHTIQQIVQSVCFINYLGIWHSHFAAYFFSPFVWLFIFIIFYYGL